MYSNLLEKLSELLYFTPVMVMQLMERKNTTVLQWLSREVVKGRILRIKRGRYMTSQYYLSHKHEEGFVASVAYVIEPNSYLTGAWVLQKYGILTESVYKVTSMTTRHAKIVENEIGVFAFSQIKSELFGGYDKVWSGRNWGYEASKAKALYDYFYERKTPVRIREDDYSIREDERLNLEDWGESDMEELLGYVKLVNSPKMVAIAKKLKELM